MSNLDTAFLAMEAGDSQHFYQILAETPLYLVLDAEAEGDTITPRLFDLPTGALVVAFDSQDRMADWAAQMGLGILPYAMLPGRIIAQNLKDVALGLNFGAPSQTILPPEAMAWLTEMLDVTPEPIQARIAEILPLGVLPPQLMAALDMALVAHVATSAHLAAVRYDSGALGHILALTGTAPQAQAPLTRAIAQSLAFSGIEAGVLDVTFVPENFVARLAGRGRALTLPQAAAPEPRPARDPSLPPKLR